MDDLPRQAAVAAAASRIADLNAERGDTFQDLAMAEVRRARETFREDPAGETPAPGADPLFDALVEIERCLDASPETVATACDAALEAAGVGMPPAVR